MTKHIDLLRSYQQKKKSADSDATALHADGAAVDAHMHNPYSLPKGKGHPSVAGAGAGEKLPEEVISFDAGVMEEPVAHVSAQQPLHDSHAFHVSTWLLDISRNIQHIFQAAQQQKPSDVASLYTHLQKLFAQLEYNNDTLNALELEISRNIKTICATEASVNDLVQKSIMMMLYTIKISFQLKLEQQELIQHTLAAMLHHIGMTMVPDEIRKKVGKLSDEELKLIKQAPERAVAYLKSCHIDNETVLTAIAQASERYDGSGGTGLIGRKIAWPARIIGLLSMFESLIHLRPYRQRLLPRDAIRELVNKHKKSFDPVLLKALIESISLYPVGTFVQLNTGEIGQVITVHHKFPLRPVVHINMDKYGNIITKREINLKQQPNLMIKKCMYEESLEESVQ